MRFAREFATRREREREEEEEERGKSWRKSSGSEVVTTAPCCATLELSSPSFIPHTRVPLPGDYRRREKLSLGRERLSAFRESPSTVVVFFSKESFPRSFNLIITRRQWIPAKALKRKCGNVCSLRCVFVDTSYASARQQSNLEIYIPIFVRFVSFVWLVPVANFILDC